MNQIHGKTTAPEADGEPRSFGVIEVLTLLAKQKRLLIALPIVTALVVAAISLLLAPVYRANATILPPQQGQSSAAALLSQLGGGGAMLSAAGLKNPNDVYVGMLKSRTIADRLVKQFALLKAYDIDSLEKAREQLGASTSVGAGKSGLITVAVEDTDPARAAALTNAYIDELVKLTKVLAVTEASQRRLFFERQLEISKDNLSAAELQLKRALDRNGVISVDSESRAIVATVAQVRAQISAKEIQLSAMKAFVTPNNQEFKRTQEELLSLRGELGRLENGRPGSGDKIADQNPQGLENIKVLREVKYHQMLYELLAKQFEMARLDESSNSSIIQILDPAVTPENKFKPKRAILVLIAAMIAFFVAVALAFARESLSRWHQSPAGAEKWNEFRRHLRGRSN